jgi:dihydropyrimidinase
MCHNPARVFGLMGKGLIAPGFDADLVLFDPRKKWLVRGEELHTAAGYSPFDGWELTGRVISTLLRGKTLLEEGQFVGRPGDGKLVRRSIELAGS